MTLGKFPILWDLNFLIYKVGIMIMPTSFTFYEDLM